MCGKECSDVPLTSREPIRTSISEENSVQMFPKVNSVHFLHTVFARISVAMTVQSGSIMSFKQLLISVGN